MASVKLNVGDEIVVLQDIRLANGDVIHKGAAGYVVSVARDDIGGATVRFHGSDVDTMVWTGLIDRQPTPAPQDAPSEPQPSALDGGEDGMLTDAQIRELRLALGAPVGIPSRYSGEGGIKDALADMARLLVYIEAQRSQLAAAENALTAANARNQRLSDALEPFAESWLRVPFGLRSTLRIWNGLVDEESRDVSIGVSTDTLQDAHTAFFNLAKSDQDTE